MIGIIVKNALMYKSTALNGKFNRSIVAHRVEDVNVIGPSHRCKTPRKVTLFVPGKN